MFNLIVWNFFNSSEKLHTEMKPFRKQIHQKKEPEDFRLKSCSPQWLTTSTVQSWALSSNKIDKYTNMSCMKRYLAVGRRFSPRLTSCCHQSFNNSSNKEQIYVECFHGFASNRFPLFKINYWLITSLFKQKMQTSNIKLSEKTIMPPNHTCPPHSLRTYWQEARC